MDFESEFEGINNFEKKVDENCSVSPKNVVNTNRTNQLFVMASQLKIKELPQFSKPVKSHLENKPFAKIELNKHAASLVSNLMEKEKIYLNPNLSLLNVADSLKIPPYRLSFAVTQEYGKSYHEVVNAYRIEHAKKLLLSPAFKFYSIDGIGVESGFGNKTTFYSTFKKITGVTPAEYRKQNKD